MKVIEYSRDEIHIHSLGETRDPRFPYAPRDSEGFTVSFDLEQEKEIHDFYDKYGFVVIKDVLSKEELKSTEDDIWDTLSKMNEYIKKDDPFTWGKCLLFLRIFSQLH